MPPSFGVSNVTKTKGFRVCTRYPLVLPFTGSNIGDRKMGRRRNEKPRLHKASGRAFIELGGKRIYLEATYGTKEAEKEYTGCTVNGLRMTGTAGHLCFHPAEVQTVAETMTNIGRQLAT